MKMRSALRHITTQLLLAVVVLLAGLSPEAHAQNAPASGVLFENVRVFNGKDGVLSQPANVLVVGNTIQAISASPIPPPANVTIQRIDGQGRTLMPGLIDNHWHTMLARPTPFELLDADIGYINLLAGAEAGRR
jgi:imidazolonepropionase-like amidohydrolase